MHVPLGVLRPASGCRRRPRRPAIAVDDTAPAPRVPSARPVRRRVGARRTAAAELAHHPQHPLEPPAERAAAADGAREEIRSRRRRRSRPLRARPAPACCLARNVPGASTARRGGRAARDASSCRARMAPKLAGGSAIARRRSASASDAAGESLRAPTPAISERTAATAATGLRSRASARWPSTARYRRASAGRRDSSAHDVGLQASGREQRRLHGERLELLARGCRRRRRPSCRRSTPARRARPAPPRRCGRTAPRRASRSAAGRRVSSVVGRAHRVLLTRAVDQISVPS